MDEIKNPFSPGAGSPPPELVGRSGIIRQTEVLLGRTLNRKPEKSMLLTGLRGVGKTVLLNEMERLAQRHGYHTISIEAHENKSLGACLAPYLRKLFFEFNRLAGTSDKVKKGLIALRNFIGTIRINYGDFGLDLDPLPGVADSGDLENDLPELFQALSEAALEKQSAVAILIDEIQYFKEKELSALIMAMHRIQQRQSPIVLMGAGLPILPGLAGDSKSYAERLFSFPDVGALSRKDVARALQEPARREGAVFTDEALDKIYRLTHGYPYFLQEWGYQAWKQAQTEHITLDVINQATEKVIERLDQNFFRVRFDRLTPGEKKFLRAMAELRSERMRAGDIAQVLGITVNKIGPNRAHLMKKGMIYSPSYGELAFTVPLFGDFMLRTIPEEH